MFLQTANGFRDPGAIDDRVALLETAPQVQPLRELSADLVVRRLSRSPEIVVPHFDPADAGASARVLLLLEAPGPKTVREWGGSGFISCDNDDPTAANIWKTRNEVGLDRGVLIWNIVPWVLGKSDVKPGPEELAQGGMELRRLISILPDLRGVVLCGQNAQRGWTRYVAPLLESQPRPFATCHPSSLGLARKGNREQFTETLHRAARLAA